MCANQKYIPGQVIWEITLRCNLKCLHCGSSAGKARPNKLSTKEALQLCKDLAKLNAQEVCLMGGEPFLRKDWHIIAKQIRDLNMKLLVISNGYNINKDIISKLVDLDPHSVSTSLDGSTAKTHNYIRGVKGSFDKVMEYISLSKEANLPTTVITTVSKLNLKELPEIRDFLLNKRIAWQIQVATPVGRFTKKFALSKEVQVVGAHCFGYHPQHLPWLGLYPGCNGCQAGISVSSIKSNGDVIGCLSIPESKIEGNIRKRSIIDIWNDPNTFSYNRKFKVEDLGENCQKCKYDKECKGGCTTRSSSITGIPRNDPCCFYRIEKELLNLEKKDNQ